MEANLYSKLEDIFTTGIGDNLYPKLEDIFTPDIGE